MRNLLSNDSGRFWSLESDYGALVQARNRTRYAVGLTQQYAPGSAWAYNNAAIQVLEAVLRRATGMPGRPVRGPAPVRAARHDATPGWCATERAVDDGLLRPADHLPGPGPLRHALPGRGEPSTAAAS